MPRMCIRQATVALIAPLFVLGLVACSRGEPSPEPFAYGAEVYLAGDRAGIIEAHVRDPLPLSEATLIDDHGQSFAAMEITRERVLYRGSATPAPGFGFGIMGGSSGRLSTGFGFGIPFFGGAPGQTVSVNESFARFNIPDSHGYDANWQRWKIRLLLDDGRSTRVIEMLPPRPPTAGP